MKERREREGFHLGDFSYVELNEEGRDKRSTSLMTNELLNQIHSATQVDTSDA
jgi:hypothetical protein